MKHKPEVDVEIRVKFILTGCCLDSLMKSSDILAGYEAVRLTDQFL